MRPKPPRTSSYSRSWEEELTLLVFWAMALATVVWELGWVILSLAGAGPRGQLPAAFLRVIAAGRLALANHPVPGGLPHVLWAARPVSTVAVILVIAGLLVAGGVVVRLVLRVLGFSGGGGGWRRGGGGRGGPGGGQPPATVDKSLDEWLASVANGDDEE